MLRRLNWGCGPITPPGWVNSDLNSWPGVDVVADINERAAIPDDEFDYIVGIHVLPELPYRELDGAGRTAAACSSPAACFGCRCPTSIEPSKPTAAATSTIFSFPTTWCSAWRASSWCSSPGTASRAACTPGNSRRTLARNGFQAITRDAFRRSSSGLVGITDLDDRPLESLFVEARK